jgi:cytochrome b561
VSVFGLFYLPDLVPHDDGLFRLMVAVHHWLAYALIACFAAHVGAALYHHFALRDDTLRRMLP